VKKLLIAFDLDDTLYPERDYVLSGFKAVSKIIKNKLGGDNIYPELIKTFNSGERRRTFNVTLERLGKKYDESLVKYMVNHYRKHIPDIHTYEDVSPTLEFLKQNHNLALVTDGYSDVQKNKVCALNIEKFFKKIIYTDEYGKDYWKPNLKVFQMAMDYFVANKDECTYIGDNIKKDFYSPNQLGWLTIQIKRKNGLYSNNHASHLNNKEFQPKVEINTLFELKEVLIKHK